jgi:hypothetical protein
MAHVRMTSISLTQGQSCVVDAEDYEWLSQWKWYAAFNSLSRKFYAARQFYHNRKKGTILMHRVIIGAELDQIVDHQDLDTLNNTRRKP